MKSSLKWSPIIEPFENFEKIFQNFVPSFWHNQVGYMPAIDMYEEKNNVIIEAELAGIDPEEVVVSIENDVVIIRGESKKKSEVDDINYYRKEIHNGSFYRLIRLSSHVVANEGKAVSSDGILKITIPKSYLPTATTIKIETKDGHKF